MIEVLGREVEAQQIGKTLGHARHGRGGALLVVGEPGIGKTTLLRSSTTGAGEDTGPAGMRRIQVDGFEAEAQMPFAAVQRLVMPLRDYLPALPERHLRALEVASGRAAGPPPDRFLIGLGVLGLLAAAGSQRPVLCAIDDAHLFDPESLDALAFVARRLEAESVAVVFAARPDDNVDAHMAGVPRLPLGGLSLEHSVRLLARSVAEPIDPAVGAQIAVATGGNPLALTDLARELTVRQLTESSLGDQPFPVGRRLESFYVRQIRALGNEVQEWLLVAAADATGDLALISEAAAKLGLPESAADGAEEAGLVELAAQVRFRHPLVRSAAYNAAAGRIRRRVHHALSEVADSMGRADLEAWHAAKATLGTDEAVAARLEKAADRAGERGGFTSRPVSWPRRPRSPHRGRAGTGGWSRRPRQPSPQVPRSWPRTCSTTSTRTNWTTSPAGVCCPCAPSGPCSPPIPRSPGSAPTWWRRPTSSTATTTSSSRPR
ncbi:hypothetical protein Kisp01_44310 [Kineosporia sp. NBRC 101677]|uniref:AAA family ATPase n=1 Tax=Kineosporia sp. NBRC 101677 TaxID=3032197 RepID=UPI0024A452A0|nr:AAA family ATPase [Kineosporia sp. NBRC 101677]GLY17417.1 hypothetical protein Kisp01_44310 [Kineosporia sp. NBRC 101677]